MLRPPRPPSKILFCPLLSPSKNFISLPLSSLIDYLGGLIAAPLTPARILPTRMVSGKEERTRLSWKHSTGGDADDCTRTVPSRRLYLEGPSIKLSYKSHTNYKLHLVSEANVSVFFDTPLLNFMVCGACTKELLPEATCKRAWSAFKNLPMTAFWIRFSFVWETPLIMPVAVKH